MAIAEPELINEEREITRDPLQVEAAQETALVAVAVQRERALFERMAGMEEGLELFERRSEILERCRRAAIRQTSPNDWVLFRAENGEAVAMLAGAGTNKVAEVYGIQISNIRPSRGDQWEPNREELEGGVVQLRAWCDAYCGFNGRHETIEASKISSESFTGRRFRDGRICSDPDAPALEADLRSSLLTSLRNKAVRVLAGMSQVPTAELELAWQGTNKKVENCRKGSGFGSATDRRADAVTSDDVKTARDQLRDEVLRCVGGDEGGAKQLLRDITKGNKPGKDGKTFPGFSSTSRMTKDWQVNNALERLKDHPLYSPPGEREPGED